MKQLKAQFNKRVFVAIPQYVEMVPEEVIQIAADLNLPILHRYEMALHPAVELALQGIRGPDTKICKWTGSIVDQARCALFGLWLKEWRAGNQYDYFLMIDSDVSFAPGVVTRLIEHNLPFVGGACARRGYVLKDRKDMPVVNGLLGEGVQPNGLVRVACIGGAFVLCRSDLLFEMMKHYPELRCFIPTESNNTDGEKYRESYAFWLPMLRQDEADGKVYYVGEDFSFCHRAREAGFDVWLDSRLNLIHWEGTKPLRADWQKVVAP